MESFLVLRMFNYKHSMAHHDCRGQLLGQSFVSSGSARGLLQDEDHSGSHPHSFPGLCHMRCGTSPEWPCISGFKRESSRRDNAPNTRFSVLLNSWDNFFVTLPSISSENWVMQSSCDLRTFEFWAKLLLGRSSQFSLFNAANFLLLLRVAIFYGENNYQWLIIDCFLLKWKSIFCFTVSEYYNVWK